MFPPFLDKTRQSWPIEKQKESYQSGQIDEHIGSVRKRFRALRKCYDTCMLGHTLVQVIQPQSDSPFSGNLLTKTSAQELVEITDTSCTDIAQPFSFKQNE